MSSTVASYLNLTKPRIVVLFVITGSIGLFAEGGNLAAGPWGFWALFLGLVFTAASANAFNMYVDQDIDSLMERTRMKRAIPRGLRTGRDAVVLGLVTGMLAFLCLYYFTNSIAALLSLFTIVFYAVVYTIWLKRTTHHNTFWGGIAGAMAPLIASAAVNGGSISPLAWSLFAIILIWQPPHFWPLAITLKDDYARAKIPMLPVKFGEAYTRKAIFVYTVILAPVSMTPYWLGGTSAFYAVAMLFLNAYYLYETIQMMRKKTHAACRRLFFVSLFYLTILFVVLLVDVAFFAHRLSA